MIDIAININPQNIDLNPTPPPPSKVFQVPCYLSDLSKIQTDSSFLRTNTAKWSRTLNQSKASPSERRGWRGGGGIWGSNASLMRLLVVSAVGVWHRCRRCQPANKKSAVPAAFHPPLPPPPTHTPHPPTPPCFLSETQCTRKHTVTHSPHPTNKPLTLLSMENQRFVSEKLTEISEVAFGARWRHRQVRNLVGLPLQ